MRADVAGACRRSPPARPRSVANARTEWPYWRPRRLREPNALDRRCCGLTLVMPPPIEFHLHLLDELELRRGTDAIALPLPAQRLVAYLALHRRPVNRRSVAEALWPDCDEKQAGARLRSTLWRLPERDGLRPIDLSGPRLSLSEHVELDVELLDDDERFAELGVARLGAGPAAAAGARIGSPRNANGCDSCGYTGWNSCPSAPSSRAGSASPWMPPCVPCRPTRYAKVLIGG